jgi:undecaprenyl-diphosphatase
MNAFDTEIQRQLVNLASSSIILTNAMRVFADLYLFKGLFPLSMLCAIWFKPGDSLQQRREMVIATLIAALVAFLLGRLLAQALPFRVRPIHNPELHLAFPVAGDAEKLLRTWSSFPSDHAAIWMAMAVGIFLTWRWLGMLVIIQCVLFVCLPRVFLGLHYPTDVIGGSVIGAVTAWFFTLDRLRERFAPAIIRFMEKQPAVGYTLAFLFFFELATMFEEPRQIASSFVKVL